MNDFGFSLADLAILAGLSLIWVLGILSAVLAFAAWYVAQTVRGEEGHDNG